MDERRDAEGSTAELAGPSDLRSRAHRLLRMGLKTPQVQILEDRIKPAQAPEPHMGLIAAKCKRIIVRRKNSVCSAG